MNNPLKSDTYPSKSSILEQLERINQSHVLGRSKINRKLINYLVDYYLDNLAQDGQAKAPKEIEIATKALDKSEDFNPAEDASIRVYISNLRKKLDVYYQTEGIDEDFQITIPPGGYGLEFVVQKQQVTDNIVTATVASEIPQQQLTSPPQNTLTTSFSPSTNHWLSKRSAIGIVAILSLSLLLNLWLFVSQTTNQEAVIRQHSFWQPLFTNQKPTLIVIGDLYMITEKDPQTNRPRAIREFSINNETDLKKYFVNYPQKRDTVGKSASAFLLKNSVFSLQHILPLFNSPHEVTIRLASNLSPSDLRDYNLIYLGLYKSLGLLDAYFQGSNFHIIESPPSLKHNTRDISYAMTGNLQQEYTDFGSFAKFAGPSGNQVYLLAGFSDASIIQMAKYLTNINKLESAEFLQHYEKLVKNKSNFELIFSASSFDRTDLDSTIVNSGPLDVKSIWAMPN
ncbi:helix-turn-helix domain-containing protein [Paraglaciecola sp.]|uniref:helix-turn-helix domain-containing protein n=1 Tax=Paraglaciecola sp. TaxID=1920173 RepID=UPI003EF90010